MEGGGCQDKRYACQKYKSVLPFQKKHASWGHELNASTSDTNLIIIKPITPKRGLI